MPDRLLSVVTPFYNSMRFIDVPLNSMLNQTYQNWEYICVDDCSTDGTLEKLREYAAKDPRIKVIAREKNGGSAAGACNEGMLAATGEYIQGLGHDDELSPDLLANIAKRIDETNAEVIIPDARIVGKEISEDIEDYDFIAIRSVGKSKDSFKTGDRSVVLSGREAFALSINWRIHGWACYSTDLIKRSPLMNENILHSDELWSRTLLLNADKVAFCEGRYVYLRRKESISTKINVKSFDSFGVTQELLNLLKTRKLGGKTLKIWKKELLSKVQMQTYRYVFNKHLLTEDDRKKVKNILRQAWKMAFRAHWYNIGFYTTALAVRKNIGRYKKYLYLKDRLQKKGLLS